MNKSVDKGNRKLTINDVASDLGLSKTTISRAISGKGRISEETRERVMAYIEENNYTPNVIAKGLAQSKTFNIGVVLPADSNLTEIPFFQKCLLGICESASENNYDVIVTATANNDVSSLKRIINNNKVDGIILTRSLVNDIYADYLKKRNIPFVLIGSSQDSQITQIDNDHAQACNELTSILINQGYKRLALVGGDMEHVVSQMRYKGFVEAVEQNSIVFDEKMFLSNRTTKQEVDKAVEDIIKNPVDCIICMDDMICSHVISKLIEKKIQIPKDIRVASFYDSDFLENYNPPVTALKFNVKELGVVACKILIDRFENVSAYKKILLNYEIAIKESTK